VFAKLAAPRPRPVPRPSEVAPAHRPAARAATPGASVHGIAAVTGLFGLLASGGAYLFLRPPAQAAVPAHAAVIPASVKTPPRVVDTEPPPLPAVVAEPPPEEALSVDAGEIPEEDRLKAKLLADLVSAGSPLGAAELASAEDLYQRYPGERPVVSLLEGVLLGSATQARSERRFPQATAHLERAAALRPDSARPRLLLLAVMLEAGDWVGSEKAAREVVALEPRNHEALGSLGYALMRQDRNAEAVDALTASLAIHEDARVRQILDKIQKAVQDEQGMKEQLLSHFHVRYDGDAHESVGREILRALERHYATLSSTLDHQPATTIPVILFTRERYYDAAGAPAWSGGAYDLMDGRIRIPVGGLDASLTPDMEGTLIHELTHAFVNDRTRGKLSRELHEGLAQYMEGKRLDGAIDPRRMRELADGRLAPASVEGLYLGGLSFVEYLMGLRGQGGMNDLLQAVGETGDMDEAFRRVHGNDMRTLQQAWRDRLRQQYGS
jgi:tetratricopeptide (TPR) repeat protein